MKSQRGTAVHSYHSLLVGQRHLDAQRLDTYGLAPLVNQMVG